MFFESSSFFCSSSLCLCHCFDPKSDFEVNHNVALRLHPFAQDVASYHVSCRTWLLTSMAPGGMDHLKEIP